jgi:hypothetical protein
MKVILSAGCFRPIFYAGKALRARLIASAKTRHRAGRRANVRRKPICLGFWPVQKKLPYSAKREIVSKINSAYEN